VRHQVSNPSKTTTITKSYTTKTDLQVCIFSIFFSIWELSKAHRCAVVAPFATAVYAERTADDVT